MDIWMYGYMDVWMYECMDVWMYGCMDVWMYGCMDVWVYGCMDVWMYADMAKRIAETKERGLLAAIISCAIEEHRRFRNVWSLAFDFIKP